MLALPDDMATTDMIEVKPMAEQRGLRERSPAPRRLAREHQTMAAMIGCYCQAQHHSVAGLCPECQQLLDYAALRLERCRFGAEKPVCAKCPVHCYQRLRREQIRAVMRFAGPRMVWLHPVLSLRHWLDGFRRAPAVV